MNYFIMKNSINGIWIVPLTDEEDNVILFDTLEQAQEYTKNCHLCNEFGYEIFKRGNGEY